MAERAEKILIVGAGAIGVNCAFFLQREGFDVTIVDRVGPGESCSYGNAAGIAFSEIIPISRPGLISKVPKWLLDPKGPLSLRPSYFLPMVPWLMRFMAAGREEWVAELTEAAAALSRSGAEDFRTVLKAIKAEDQVFGEFCAAIYDSEREFQNDAWEWELRTANGFPFTKLSGGEINELEPDISPDVACALVMEGWRNLKDPYRFVVRLAEHVERNGGTFVSGEVRDFETSDRRVAAAVLEDGTRLEADHVVIAAGAWSHRLATRLGSKVPLEADRGYNKTMPNTGITLKRQLVYGAAGIAITPLPQGLRIGGAVEFAGVDAPPDYRRSDYLVEKAKKILPGLRDTSGERWMGPRPGLPDFVPVIGGSPHFGNVAYSFGHGHLGLTWSPVTGRLIAAHVAGKPVDIDMEPYRVNRF